MPMPGPDEELLVPTGLEGAIIGTLVRAGQPPIAVVDVRLAAEIVAESNGIPYEDALEYIEFNAVSAWYGPETPGWFYAMNDEAYDEEGEHEGGTG